MPGAPRTPDYNASADALAGHHWLIAQQAAITPAEGAQIDELFRDRWRTLLSVDDAVAGVVGALDELGALDDTYIILTSDHGYNLGNHRLPSCKLNVYDHDTRIPCSPCAQPGVRARRDVAAPGSNVDVLPTLLALAGGVAPAPGAVVDGRDASAHFLAARARVRARAPPAGAPAARAAWRDCT